MWKTESLRAPALATAHLRVYRRGDGTIVVVVQTIAVYELYGRCRRSAKPVYIR